MSDPRTPGPRPPRSLDVRPLLANGIEPFPRVMEAVARLGAGDSLTLVTPFLPSPLIEKLQSEGFEARPTRRTDGAWETRLRKPAA